jgi:hypothetical protein
MQINGIKYTNFFEQPAEGFDQHSQGRTAKIGFALPSNYRKIMQMQNGGSVRYKQINGVEQFDFHCGFRELRPDLDYYIYQFNDYILASYSDEDLQEAKETLEPFNPERLIIISDLDGHGTICFDYGYRTKSIVETPAVVIIDDDDSDDTADKSFMGYTEAARFEHFEDFLQNLKVDTENQSENVIGIVSQVNYETTIQAIAKHFSLALESYESVHGNYDPEIWFVGHLPLYLDDETLQQHAKNTNSEYAELLAWSEEEGRIRNIRSEFSRNQHFSGTYLFPDNLEVTVVIIVRKTWFAMQKPLEGLMIQLKQIPEISDVIMLE